MILSCSKDATLTAFCRGASILLHAWGSLFFAANFKQLQPSPQHMPNVKHRPHPRECVPIRSALHPVIIHSFYHQYPRANHPGHSLCLHLQVVWLVEPFNNVGTHCILVLCPNCTNIIHAYHQWEVHFYCIKNASIVLLHPLFIVLSPRDKVKNLPVVCTLVALSHALLILCVAWLLSLVNSWDLWSI